MQQAGSRDIKSAISPTLAINELVHSMRDKGRKIFHMGFGEAPFPVPPRMMDALRDNARERSYLPVAGLPQLCKAVAEHQAFHADVDMERFDVLIGPGSKIILFALQMAIPGDTLLPVPSWVSYSPQSKLLGQHVVPVPMGLSGGGLVLEAAAIDQAVEQARAAGHNPTKLLINFPSNPTGLTIDDATLLSIVEVCRSRNLILISDEIYGRLSFDHRYRSAARHFPEGCVVTTGLSKHLSLGGWRLGISLIPKSLPGLFEDLCHIASETWSCVAAPVQIAAVEAYLNHPDIEAFITSTTDIHAYINRRIAEQLSRLGVNCVSPQGGFYTWPDFSNVLDGVYTSSEQMAASLLEQHGVATLPGVVFGEDSATLKLRLSGCDYDGETALDIWASSGGPGTRADLLERMAPNITAALTELGSFIFDCNPATDAESTHRPEEISDR